MTLIKVKAGIRKSLGNHEAVVRYINTDHITQLITGTAQGQDPALIIGLISGEAHILDRAEAIRFLGVLDSLEAIR